MRSSTAFDKHGRQEDFHELIIFHCFHHTLAIQNRARVFTRLSTAQVSVMILWIFFLAYV